jgi:L-arabonate dehydrase
MVRISDARMSGTAYGTVAWHMAPEAAIGGPLALVRNGDLVSLDVGTRTLTLNIGEFERRRLEWKPPPTNAVSAYQSLHVQHTLQADRGCDLDFLIGRRNAGIPRESH